MKLLPLLLHFLSKTTQVIIIQDKLYLYSTVFILAKLGPEHSFIYSFGNCYSYLSRNLRHYFYFSSVGVHHQSTGGGLFGLLSLLLCPSLHDFKKSQDKDPMNDLNNELNEKEQERVVKKE